MADISVDVEMKEDDCASVIPSAENSDAPNTSIPDQQNDAILPISSIEEDHIAIENPVDALGLLAEAVSRDRNDTDEDDDEAHTPDSAHDQQDERDIGDECEEEERDEDLNMEQDNFEEQDDQIDIHDDFVLQYDSNEEKDSETNASDSKQKVVKSTSVNEITEFSEKNMIMDVVSLASTDKNSDNENNDSTNTTNIKSVQIDSESCAVNTEKEMDEPIKVTNNEPLTSTSEIDKTVDKLDSTAKTTLDIEQIDSSKCLAETLIKEFEKEIRNIDSITAKSEGSKKEIVTEIENEMKTSFENKPFSTNEDILKTPTNSTQKPSDKSLVQNDDKAENLNIKGSTNETKQISNKKLHSASGENIAKSNNNKKIMKFKKKSPKPLSTKSDHNKSDASEKDNIVVIDLSDEDKASNVPKIKKKIKTYLKSDKPPVVNKNPNTNVLSIKPTNKLQKPKNTTTGQITQTSKVSEDVVVLDESSSDSEEKNKSIDSKKKQAKDINDWLEVKTEEKKGTTTVCIPSSIEVTSSSTKANPSKISTNSGASVISGLPISMPKQSASMRINTAEITISTVSRGASESDTPVVKPVEILNLDSDDEDDFVKPEEPPKVVSEPVAPVETQKEKKNKDIVDPAVEAKKLPMCISCSRESDSDVTLVECPLFALGMLKIKRLKREKHPEICTKCLDMTIKETENLITKFCNQRSLFNTEIATSDDLVEILDSDSDGEHDDNIENLVHYSNTVFLPIEEVDFIVNNLPETLDNVCQKFNIEKQVDLCTESLTKGIAKLRCDSQMFEKEIDNLQKNTERLRHSIYNNIRIKREILPEVIIPTDNDGEYMDTGRYNQSDDSFGDKCGCKREREDGEDDADYRKRRSSRVRRPIDYTLESEDMKGNTDNSEFLKLTQDAKDNANSLPSPGPYVLPPLQVGNAVYTVKQSIFGAWIAGTIIEISPVGTPMANGMRLLFSLLTVKFNSAGRQTVKQVTGRQVAHSEPAKVRYPIGTRVIALFKDTGTVKKDAFYSGVIAESPSMLNRFRYLVFFDDGYSQYVQHQGILPVSEKSSKVWEDVHPDSRDFVRKYLVNYPDRPMVRTQPGQILRTEKNGAWWEARVIALDASLVLLRFEGACTRDEWIYRGSTRLFLLYQQLQAADRRAHAPGRHRPMGAIASRSTTKIDNVPYVEYTRNDSTTTVSDDEQSENEARAKPQRAVAKKSTSTLASNQKDLTPEVMDAGGNLVKSRVVYYSPKLWIHPEEMVPHTCNPKCLITKTKTLPLSGLRTYNPLARPLLSAWERLTVKYRNKRVIMYRAPCGRRLRNMEELHKYLMLTKSKMSVDLFDFDHRVHCLAEFVLIKCYVSKPDISHGVEALPVPCVNYYDQSLPEFWSYSTRRQATKGVELNLDEDFLCACDCTDDCQDKEKCQCWQLTYEGARFVGSDLKHVGYQYKRLLEQVSTGIYECNSRCKCAATCLNRVVQHPLQLKLQVFKTYNRGWGIRALNDIPKGSFICIYAGNLLTDAVANVDGGTLEGDKYLADLDYIEVVERLKENYESDIPEEDQLLDSQKSDSQQSDDEDERHHRNEYLGRTGPHGESDEEFNPGYFEDESTSEIRRRLRPRHSRKPSNEETDDTSDSKIRYNRKEATYKGKKVKVIIKNMFDLSIEEGDKSKFRNEKETISTIEEETFGDIDESYRAEEDVSKNENSSPDPVTIDNMKKTGNETSTTESETNKTENDTNKTENETNKAEIEPKKTENTDTECLKTEIKKEIINTTEDSGNDKDKKKPEKRVAESDDNPITISDDEEIIREPSRFAAPEGFDDNEYVPRPKQFRSVRSFYGDDDACFIMDAKVRGNIGRYLNHSCAPNVFVQNVFVDTHDPRFPWVAFFALVHIRAGTELTWNYNYDVGSVPGKVIYCRCGALNCRGRLL